MYDTMLCDDPSVTVVTAIFGNPHWIIFFKKTQSRKFSTIFFARCRTADQIQCGFVWMRICLFHKFLYCCLNYFCWSSFTLDFYIYPVHLFVFNIKKSPNEWSWFCARWNYWILWCDLDLSWAFVCWSICIRISFLWLYIECVVALFF